MGQILRVIDLNETISFHFIDSVFFSWWFYMSRQKDHKHIKTDRKIRYTSTRRFDWRSLFDIEFFLSLLVIDTFRRTRIQWTLRAFTARNTNEQQIENYQMIMYSNWLFQSSIIRMADYFFRLSENLLWISIANHSAEWLRGWWNDFKEIHKIISAPLLKNSTEQNW